MLRRSSSFAARTLLSAFKNALKPRSRPAPRRRRNPLGVGFEVLEAREVPSVNVSTYHYDLARDGANTNETVLTPSNVNTNTFGKVATFSTDAQVYAQPLVQTGVAISGQGTHDIAIIATENDTVYAFDAEGNNPAQGYLWKTSLLQSGETAVPQSDYGTNDITPLIGITGTPVIDPTNQVMYVVGAFKESNSTYQQRLYELNLTSGAVVNDVVINASVPGTGYDSSNGTVTFNSFRENQRPALTLANGNVYVGFSSHGDEDPWHGWLIAYNSSTLAQDYVYNTTPNGEEGGIWMSGGGIAVDSSGNLYFSTGNGTFDANNNGGDYSMAIEKLSPSLAVQDYFAPYNESSLSGSDLDYGCSSVILLPTQSGSAPNEVLTAGKWGTMYLNNSNTGSMGEFVANGPNNDLSQVNFVSNPTSPNLHNSIAYWNGYAYVGADNQPLQAFTAANGALGQTASSKSTNTFGTGGLDGQGCNPTISSNGTSNGIVWAVDNSGFNSNPAVLYAYNANNLSQTLWASNQAANGRDTGPNAVKFQDAVVANGYVYVAGAGSVTVYGLLGSVAVNASKSVTQVGLSSSYNIPGAVNDGSTFTGGLDGFGSAYSSNLLGSSVSWNGESFTIGAPGGNDAIKGTGQTITLTQGTYTSIDFLGAAVNGSQTAQTFTINYTDGSHSTVTQGLSDWYTGASQAGEAVASTMAYRDVSNGTKDSRTFYLYGYSLPVNDAKTVQSITLPNNGNVTLLAINEVRTAEQLVLNNSFNRQGIYKDGTSFSTGGLDGGGSALSGNLLGTSQSYNGNAFAIGATGGNNVVNATGQTISLVPGQYSTLSFLATGTNGSWASQTFTVHYSDNSTQTFTQGISDWHHPQGYTGETSAVPLAYKDLSTGGTQSAGSQSYEVYGYTFTLNNSKTVTSITLPNNNNVDVLSIDEY